MGRSKHMGITMVESNNKKCLYRSNNKHKFKIVLNIFISLVLFLMGSFIGFVGEYILCIPPIFIAFGLLYLFLFVFPNEVLIDDSGLLYKSIIRTQYIPFSKIAEVKPYCHPRALTWAGGNKKKAAIYYFIKIKNKPYNFLIVGTGISEYRKLYARIVESLPENTGEASRIEAKKWLE